MAGRLRQQASSLYPAALSHCRLPFDVDDLEGVNLRYALLDLFLTTPAGELELMRCLHERMFRRDPVFYGFLATWYIQRGTIMDHKEIFLANLLTSPCRGHRERASRLLPLFPVRELSRTVDYCKRVVQKFPRIARTGVREYLRRLEEKPERFDNLVLGSRKHLKHLYASLRIKPSPRAQAILFEDSPPQDSRLADLKALLQEREPDAQARLILHCGTPLSIALRYVRNLTASLVVRLIETLPPAEIVQNLNVLRNRGVLKDEEVMSLLDRRLHEAMAEKKVTARLSRLVTRISKPYDDMKARAETILTRCREENIAIERPTALLIDKSGSMDEALDLGKIVAILCSSLARGSFSTFLFDSKAIELQPPDTSPESWEREFAPCSAEGPTSPGSALALMGEKEEIVEQVVLITDGNENHAPGFFEALAGYQRKLHSTPFTVIVKMGHFSRRFSRKAASSGLCGIMWNGTFDPFWLFSLMVLLSGPPRRECMEEILSCPPPCEDLHGTSRLS